MLEAKALGISAVCAGIYFCYSSIISFLTPYANEIHLQTAAAFFFIVYSIAILITRLFTGRLFDQRGAKITNDSAMQIQLSIFSWILEQEWDHFF